MATGKIIGYDDASGTNLVTGWLRMEQLQCVATGLMTEFRLKAGGSANMKVAIYADSGGEPGALINQAQSAVSAGWNIIAFPNTLLTAGASYWLAMMTDADGGGQQVSSSGKVRRYKSWAYGDGFPDPAGSGYSSSAVGYYLVAGWGVLLLSPSGISQPLSYGSPKLNLSLKPSGIAQSLSAGAPAVVTSAAIIYPPGIAQAVGVGTPLLIYPQVISPPGITQLVSIGVPSAVIVGILSPQGISVIVSCGSPTLLKYVWHVILDGQYDIESPDKNRFYVIGRDQYGNPVYGTAVDSTEIGLVGERLDFQQELAIPTGNQAASVASALLSKMRLTGKRGVILIPPNCGQELFDVVQISDSGANQPAVSFRVVGIRFEYNPKQARFEHRLILGAV